MLFNPAIPEAERRAEGAWNKYAAIVDSRSVPMAYKSPQIFREQIWETPQNDWGLPLAHAPKPVKAAITAYRNVADKLTEADDRAMGLYAEYLGAPKTAQQEVTNAVLSGKDAPSVSAIVDERQEALSKEVRDAFATVNALVAAVNQARGRAHNAFDRHRNEWRDATAAFVQAEIDKRRENAQAAVNNLAAAMNGIAELDSMSNAVHRVDLAWLGEREEAGMSKPNVYHDDEEAGKRRLKEWKQAMRPQRIDVIAEAERTIRDARFRSEGGRFQLALTAPLGSYPDIPKD
ncbi:hypothetical protein ACFYY3_08295 [Streptomyces sp. NPDC001812]|uniref:hypothetical protein n=1 Tax=Streptomyces sp. NPDC001812 TaxID=3364611 RepID=UPI0036949F64